MYNEFFIQNISILMLEASFISVVNDLVYYDKIWTVQQIVRIKKKNSKSNSIQESQKFLLKETYINGQDSIRISITIESFECIIYYLKNWLN